MDIEDRLEAIWQDEYDLFRSKYPIRKVSSGGDIELFDESGNSIGYISFSVEDKTLFIHYIKTQKTPINYRGVGATNALVASALLENRDMQSMRGEWAGDNQII